MDKYDAFPKELTPEDFYQKVMSFRRSQDYISALPEGETKSDLSTVVNLANDLICEILNEHGIETYEDMMAFEHGNFSLWKNVDNAIYGRFLQ